MQADVRVLQLNLGPIRPMNDDQKKRSRIPGVTPYGLMLVVVVSVTVFSLLLYQMAGVWMYDSNFETFQNVLDLRQQEAVIGSARQLMAPVIAALVVTNLCWAIAVGLILFRKRKESGQPPAPAAPAGS